MGVAEFATPFYLAPFGLYAVMLRNEVTMAEEGTGDDQELLIPSIGISELEKILEQHELWVESLGGEGCRADLQGSQLVGTHLQGANLKASLFQNANMERAELNHADLSKGDF